MATKTAPAKDLDAIADQPSLSLNVKGLSSKEIELIQLLGSNGYTSNINGVWIYSRPICTDPEELYEHTSEARGMMLRDISTQLGVRQSVVSNLVFELGDRTQYVFTLWCGNSSHLFKDRRKKEVVLTSTGSELYERITLANSILQKL